ncbi:MAG: ATP synthase F1 subunit gamma [Planctomycetota bacterium]
MANIKELRGRIKSVTNIAKITKAMEMVASMKLRRVQTRALASRPYTEEIQGLIGHLAASGDAVDQHDLFRPKLLAEGAKPKTAVLLLTSDRGLCGAYNANVLQQVTSLRAELGDENLTFYVIGRKGYTWLGRRGLNVEHFYAEPALEHLDFDTARLAAKDLVDAFQSGGYDQVRLVFTAFRTVARFEPMNEPFLPISPELSVRAARVEKTTKENLGDYEGSQSAGKSNDYVLEPNAKTVFERIVPKYLETVIYDAMISSLASEMASRRMAMKGATDAASRMGKDLKKTFNRVRQDSITKELLDIVGGANAVS